MNIVIKFVSLITSLMVFVGSLGIGIGSTDKKDLTRVKNVIFMIGDGMGFNSIAKAEKETGRKSFLSDGTFPLCGKSETRSANNKVTDSAAGGTALATATRVDNSSLAVYPYDKNDYVSHPENLCELAVSQGKLAGVITTDSTSGATPSSFSVHTSDRGNEEPITLQQVHGDLTLVWGGKTATYSENLGKVNGFKTITNKSEMDALKEGTKSFGQFGSETWHENSDNGMPTLTEMTNKAIDLLDDDEDGFFLMVEGAHIDKNSHKNNGDGMIDALFSFDSAVKAAVEYAKTHGDTLVIVTADHETGGIKLNEDGEYVYTKGGHTGVDVPLLIYGCDSFLENGEAIENREASRRVAVCMGENNFPIRVYNKVG